MNKFSNLFLIFVLDFSLGHSFLKFDKFESTADTKYSSSSKEMKNLIKVEIQIIQGVSKFQREQHNELQSITKYLNDFQLSLPYHGNNIKSLLLDVVSNYNGFLNQMIKNPLSIYRCLRRFVILLPNVEKDIIFYNVTVLMKMLNQFKTQISFPSPKNLEESMKSIIRLKYTYNISVDELIIGNLNGYMTGTTLQAEHCYEIAFVASQNNFWSIAIDFYEISIRLAIEDKRISIKDISRVEAFLESTIQIHDELLSIGIGLDEISPTLFQSPLENRTSPKFLTRKEQFAQSVLHNPKNHVGIEASYENLCRGEDIREKKFTKNLKCFTLRRHSVYNHWLIQPIEIEYLNENPPIVQIYNFMSSNEIQTLIEFSKPELKRSRYITGGADSQRISSSGFISDSNVNSLFFYINQRVESLTGLKVTSESSSEDLQVTHYPPGGHYSHHYDVTFDNTGESTPEIIEYGERIATFMIYLSNVELGGNTAFPILGVSASPVKGSAIFWYNLHANGSVDNRSLHGGCPVLYGTKWVANKWISSNEQMFRRKCLTEKYLDYNYDNMFHFSESYI